VGMGFPRGWEIRGHFHGNGSGFRWNGNVEKYVVEKFHWADGFDSTNNHVIVRYSC